MKSQLLAETGMTSIKLILYFILNFFWHNICYYLLSFISFGTQVAGCLQYLLFVSGHQTKYWVGLSLLNFEHTYNNLLLSYALSDRKAPSCLLPFLSGHPFKYWVFSFMLNFSGLRELVFLARLQVILIFDNIIIFRKCA